MIIDKSNINEAFLKKFGEDFFINSNLIKNLIILIKEEKLTLNIENFNNVDNTWGGTLYVNLIRGVTTYDVVNYIVGVSGADEISMPKKKSIRLWWD